MPTPRGAQAVSRAAEPPKGTLDTDEHRAFIIERRPSFDSPDRATVAPHSRHPARVMVPGRAQALICARCCVLPMPPMNAPLK
jgi:hypothetical protein